MLVETSQQDRVLRMALNRPQKRNALNGELCSDLLQALETDDSVGAIVLTGNGPVFCAGMDLNETAHTDLHELLFTFVERMRKPVIAAVRGAAMGGGVGLVANAHIVIAAPDAKFALPELKIGIWPVIVFRAIALAMGERRATELSLTGRTFTAEEALAYGLVTEIANDPERRAHELATMIAERSPLAVATGLEYIHTIRGMAWPEAGRIGSEMRDALLASPAFAEGVHKTLGKQQ